MDCKSVLLVIDDDERLQKMLAFNFVHKGFDVVSAMDGFAAIKILETLRPGIILMDLAMPDMDGFELCKRIKENAVWGEIPLIVISALSGADNRERALSLGVSDYFEKPFVLSELMERVITLMKLDDNILSFRAGKLKLKGGEI